MHNILLGLYPNPSTKAAPYLPLSWIWKVVNYFVWLKVNVPMSGQVIVINIYFLLGVAAVIMLIHTCRALYGVILGTKQYEDKSIFIFLIGAGIYG